MDPLSLAVGTAITLVGAAVGRWSRSLPQATEQEPKLMCSCGHGLGSHDEMGCRAEVPRADRWDYYRDATHWAYVPCPCSRYDGREPPLPLREVMTWQPPDERT